MSKTILEGDHSRIISAKFGSDWLCSFFREDFFFKFHHPFFYFQLGGHLDWKSGSSDTILEVGHPRIIPPKFVAIGPVVSEEKIFM